MTAIEKVIATARAEVGYLEKASNTQLDSKTANAGTGNWTKYARDLDGIGTVYNGKKNGYSWCDVFADWCFIQTFGLEAGMKLLCQPYKGLGAGCTYSMKYFKDKGQFHTSGPKPGDQIFFSSDGGKTSSHTGLVVDVKGGRVYTIEGNTSSASGVVANGGCVREKSYSLTYSKIAGYGRPDYTIVEEDNEMLTYEQWKEYMERYRQELGELPAPDWSVSELTQAVELGVTDGTRPQDLVTRAEAAAMAVRSMK